MGGILIMILSYNLCSYLQGCYMCIAVYYSILFIFHCALSALLSHFIYPFYSVILLPIAITFYITWWFIHFVDGFFSPIYAQLGIDVFGKNICTSIS